jgi:glyoxylase-like metal-dependent hydrolase (beta-lactamase superfamily II)
MIGRVFAPPPSAEQVFKEDTGMKITEQLPDSKHFRLERAADGVYAAIHIDGGAAIGNAGIVDLGDRTPVYDTMFTPQAAEDLRAVAEALTGRAIDAIINSHYHNDHIWGNLLFIEHHPWVGAGDPDRLLHILKTVADLDPKALVPGHGPVETPESLKQMREYIITLDGLARQMIENGEAGEKIDEMAVPEPYDDWLFAAFFPLNMHFLYQRRLEEGSALPM